MVDEFSKNLLALCINYGVNMSYCIEQETDNITFRFERQGETLRMTMSKFEVEQSIYNNEPFIAQKVKKAFLIE